VYRVILLGNFTSLEGDDFTTQCTTDLGNNYREKAVAMVPGLNSMLGQDMCSYVSVGDVVIVSVSALLKTNGSVVSRHT
jgi:hypothetical protein